MRSVQKKKVKYPPLDRGILRSNSLNFLALLGPTVRCKGFLDHLPTAGIQFSQLPRSFPQMETTEAGFLSLVGSDTVSDIPINHIAYSVIPHPIVVSRTHCRPSRILIHHSIFRRPE
jgi:hypothetical protein